MAITVVVSW
uniref:Uncharacterized protein n=1 Tax=Arundo donax TaxID=35708 RepID=A0A0A9HLK7_ARUDO